MNKFLNKTLCLICAKGNSQGLKNKMTIIVVSHHMSNVKDYDNLIVLENGKIKK
jgi:ABC-type multidrug transport system fused ATPase/permease subunit